MRIDYNLKDKFDFGLIFPVIILYFIGLAAIYSSTYNNPSAQGNFERQIIWGIAALIVFFITYFLPTNTFKLISIPTYLLSVLLLIIVLLIGRRISGAQSWMTIGPIGFQPSEFAKIGTILALSRFLSKRSMDIDSFKDLSITIGIGMLPVLLILLEPDMGTAIVFILFILTIIFWKGISVFAMFVVLSPAFVAVSSLFGLYYFFGALAIILVTLILFRRDLFFSGSIFTLNLASGFFADYVFRALSPHQQSRIQAFIDPMSDPLGSGYNTIQAKVAIGSGGLFGKGFLAGNQTQLQFIPEQWTDFVYCVIGEEFGFIGSIITIALFVFLFMRILKISFSSKDEFLSLAAIGILAVLFTHFMINIGMVLGIMPVIGLPLPFVSYGGSSLLTNMIMLGIVANIYRTRKSFT
ncbi:Rod shape-determining protein RodA [bacterium BMS3Abin03]|nr:Rod shape-determining protein RodA [bacterium BMS3Abin03]HDZ58544.1 rod shape-determining protein RodA [Ignavibacteriales bacterium]